MRASERLAPALLALVVAGPASAGDCAPGVADLRDADGTARFTVEVMDTAEERARGLMFRESLPEFSGMLFVYERAQPVAFWMKNTLIPLDMLFFDTNGRLTGIAREAKPLDETPVMGGDAVRYVLEINGGLAEALDIDLGAELRHPAIEDAAWGCAP